MRCPVPARPATPCAHASVCAHCACALAALCSPQESALFAAPKDSSIQPLIGTHKTATSCACCVFGEAARDRQPIQVQMHGWVASVRSACQRLTWQAGLGHNACNSTSRGQSAPGMDWPLGMQRGEDPPVLRAGPVEIVVGEIHSHVIRLVCLLIALLRAQLCHKVPVGDLIDV